MTINIEKSPIETSWTDPLAKENLIFGDDEEHRDPIRDVEYEEHKPDSHTAHEERAERPKPKKASRDYGKLYATKKIAQTPEEEDQLRTLGWSDSDIERMSERQIGIILNKGTKKRTNPPSQAKSAKMGFDDDEGVEDPSAVDEGSDSAKEASSPEDAAQRLYDAVQNLVGLYITVADDERQEEDLEDLTEGLEEEDEGSEKEAAFNYQPDPRDVGKPLFRDEMNPQGGDSAYKSLVENMRAAGLDDSLIVKKLVQEGADKQTAEKLVNPGSMDKYTKPGTAKSSRRKIAEIDQMQVEELIRSKQPDYYIINKIMQENKFDEATAKHVLDRIRNQMPAATARRKTAEGADKDPDGIMTEDELSALGEGAEGTDTVDAAKAVLDGLEDLFESDPGLPPIEDALGIDLEAAEGQFEESDEEVEGEEEGKAVQARRLRQAGILKTAGTPGIFALNGKEIGDVNLDGYPEAVIYSMEQQGPLPTTPEEWKKLVSWIAPSEFQEYDEETDEPIAQSEADLPAFNASRPGGYAYDFRDGQVMVYDLGPSEYDLEDEAADAVPAGWYTVEGWKEAFNKTSRGKEFQEELNKSKGKTFPGVTG